ncbi:MAG: outer membrane lipoprotein carrier protein LolA [Acidobacteriaceae bacterium]|nr:outer membrane lipoprotein carrier protein LolA [Acidobacteriaceae bacterium]MBV9780174.1 outer membrane lipoprotein carrier protein LolA [Acidobacteriaceae bacterium]
MFPAFCLLVVGSHLLPASSADELIQRVEKRYNGARTLSVNFTESYEIQGHARQPESGTLTLRKQGKMRWDYARPQGKLFISDGKTVYLYTAKDNRVEKLKLKDTEDMRAPLAFLLGRLDMKKEFRDFDVRSTGSENWLDASAKNDRVPYEKVEMLIAPDASIRALKVTGRDASLLSFSFDNEKLNPPAADQLFHFTIPPGAEIVDSIGLGAEEN